MVFEGQNHYYTMDYTVHMHNKTLKRISLCIIKRLEHPWPHVRTVKNQNEKQNKT